MGRVSIVRDDDALIVEFVAYIVLPRTREHYGKNFSREKLIADLESYILRGPDETQEIVALAEKGDDFTDGVLRRLFRRMIDAGEMPGATLRAYGLLPQRRKKPGRRGGVETWLNRVGVAILVVYVAEFFGLPPTRDQEPQPNRQRATSACAIVRAALERCGDHRSERTGQNIYTGVAGQLAKMWAAQAGGDLHERMRADIARAWPQWAKRGPAYLTRT